MAELKVKIYDWQGQEIGTEHLEPSLFGRPAKPGLIQSVIVAQQKNARQAIAHTKGRSEVRGGGRKPWKQKGTGRARHGSIRSPLWVGGGITFGPTSERNFSVKVNKKVRRQALAMVLSDKLAHEKLIVLDTYGISAPRTRILQQTLSKLPGKGKSILIITKNDDRAMIKSAQNLPKIETIFYGSLNVFDLLSHEYLLLNKDLLKKITEHYA